MSGSRRQERLLDVPAEDRAPQRRSGGRFAADRPVVGFAGEAAEQDALFTDRQLLCLDKVRQSIPEPVAKRFGRHLAPPVLAFLVRFWDNAPGRVAVIAYVLSTIDFRTMSTTESNSQLAEQLGKDRAQIKRALTAAYAEGILESHHSRIGRRITPGPVLIAAMQLTAPGPTPGRGDRATPGRGDRATPGRGDRATPGAVTAPPLEPPRTEPLGKCRRPGCGNDTDVDGDGRPWPVCRDCQFGPATNAGAPPPAYTPPRDVDGDVAAANMAKLKAVQKRLADSKRLPAAEPT